MAAHHLFNVGAGSVIIMTILFLLGMIFPPFAAALFLGFTGIGIIAFLLPGYVIGVLLMAVDT